ncbi:MAG: penicillin-binding protein 1A [Alphaproteobacteria bacterium]|nr:penicillin-binding protein 1A [Alphaproteobacteria bacterium]
MRFISWLFSISVLLVMLGIGSGFYVLHQFSQNLPDFQVLKNYEPAILSRVYAGDGRLLATFAAEQRIFIPIKDIPQRVKDAFLSAEDKDFYTHPGVDIFGIARAVLSNIQSMGGRRPMGASTITQQVAKNMLLGNEVSFARKIKEAILAFRIESVLSKDRILEIYLNQIFLGQHSYGVAAAALNYFNKSLDELTIAETAYLAALPKAPNNYHPVKDAAAALARRNWVISRMADDGKIAREDGDKAKAEKLEMRGRGEGENVRAEYYAEEVRRELVDAYGNTSLLKDGYAVRTSLDPKLQIIADNALRRALINFDQSRTGYRGPVAKFTNMTDWSKQLEAVEVPPGGEDWKMGVVLETRESEAILGFEGGGRGIVPFTSMRWARPQYKDKRFGPPPRKVTDVVTVGDVILVDDVVEEAKKKDDKKAETKPTAPLYRLMQVPKIQGAFVAVDPHTGRVLALVGGFSARLSSFNRATQAMRQEGSSFKPFVYLAALDNGFTPSSLINDAPIELSQGPGLPLWQPQNFDGDYMGVMTMRRALEKSRNVVTVRLAQSIGMEKVIEYAKKFGIVDDMPSYLAYCLGAKETSLLRLTTAYAMLVNGGKKILPSFIDRIQDNEGKTIWRHDRRPCEGCSNIAWNDKTPVPDLPDTREQVNDPRTTYQIVSLLEGVATRGTAASLRTLGKSLAGKTGTTNDSKDLWFVGFSPNLAAGVFIGYDEPTPLGEKETGGTMSLPIFKEFMEKALAGKPDMPFRVPPGVQLVRVDPYTGKQSFGGEEAIYEPFLPGTDPETAQRSVLGGGDPLPDELDENGNPIPEHDLPDNGMPPGMNVLPPPAQEKPPAADMGTGGLY